MIVISNAGPLIALARIRHFELLRDLFGHLLIPQAVYEEVVVKGAGRPGAYETASACGDWLNVVSVKDVTIVRSLLARLGKGESEAIALALEKKADLLLMDDLKARAVAEFMGLAVSGTVGVVFQAYRQGIVSDLNQVLDALRAKGFWIDDDVYNRVLRSK
ncbi:MAG TPA: DUF3368 domain-containing protein [Chloroflexi bacterium]|nr:DUF3368 domain-containing protein [Chloroflexota bacterium]